MLAFILSLILLGLIAGFLARALLPGRDSMGFWGTVVLGIVGSFVGGFLADLLSRGEAEDVALRPSGIVGAVIGSILALLVYRAATGRSRMGSRSGPRF
ncbi:MAG: GlsB/YeaQ/YmgE family stress response membrane protein [Acidimicrobiales bacterium]